MNIETLKLFRETARLGSFAAVARQQNTDPSNVSRAIAQLEAQMSVRLFQRSTRKLSLTEAGYQLLNRLDPILNELDHAFDEAQEAGSSPKGLVRMTASVSFGQACIVPHLLEFHTRYPDIRLELQLADAVVDIVANGIDIACRLAPPSNADLVGTRLFSTYYRICASKKYLEKHADILKPKDIEQHDCLVFTLPEFQTTWLLKDQQDHIEQVKIHSSISISSAIALKECAIQGLGLALLPNWLVDEEIKNGTLARVLPTYECTATSFETAAWLLYPSRRFLPQKTRVVIDFLKEKYNLKDTHITPSI